MKNSFTFPVLLPMRQQRQRGDDRRQQNHRDVEPIDAQTIIDVGRGDPRPALFKGQPPDSGSNRLQTQRVVSSEMTLTPSAISLISRSPLFGANRISATPTSGINMMSDNKGIQRLGHLKK